MPRHSLAVTGYEGKAMLAAGFTRIGAADVLEVIELPEPGPGPGEVLIRVAAATVNPADTLLRKGQIPYVTAPLPHVGGLECAGTIARTGPASRCKSVAGLRR